MHLWISSSGNEEVSSHGRTCPTDYTQLESQPLKDMREKREAERHWKALNTWLKGTALSEFPIFVTSYLIGQSLCQMGKLNPDIKPAILLSLKTEV